MPGYRVLGAAVLLLSLVGLASAVLAYLDYSSGGGYCVVSGGGEAEPSPLGGCGLLYSLPEAELFGVIHLSEAALVYFSSLVVLSVAWYLIGLSQAVYVLAGLYVAGALYVPYLIYLEYRVGTICPYCTVMHIVIISNSILLLRALLQGRM